MFEQWSGVIGIVLAAAVLSTALALMIVTWNMAAAEAKAASLRVLANAVPYQGGWYMAVINLGPPANITGVWTADGFIPIGKVLYKGDKLTLRLTSKPFKVETCALPVSPLTCELVEVAGWAVHGNVTIGGFGGSVVSSTNSIVTTVSSRGGSSVQTVSSGGGGSESSSWSPCPSGWYYIDGHCCPLGWQYVNGFCVQPGSNPPPTTSQPPPPPPPPTTSQPPPPQQQQPPPPTYCGPGFTYVDGTCVPTSQGVVTSGGGSGSSGSGSSNNGGYISPWETRATWGSGSDSSSLSAWFGNACPPTQQITSNPGPTTELGQWMGQLGDAIANALPDQTQWLSGFSGDVGVSGP
ncbi:MAG: hypothetical protein JZD41_01520 [Thermoproteus sp.]|nr:hypothetical protein [Thermoproteus sp.]